MENKYYTPELEEFHVGFEFEEMSDSGLMYNKKVFRFGWFDLQREIVKGIELKKIRVKHLDKEDIEELGWENNKKIDIGYFRKDEFVLRFKNEKISIYLYDENWIDTEIIKSIKIKNKSELRKLMKQLNIK